VISSKVDAQKLRTDSIFFTGAVMDQKSLKALPYSHFRVNEKRAGTANEYGRFSFWVNAGDTIHYSYVGYQDLNIVISDTLDQDSYLFGAFLTKDTVALKEVLIVPRITNIKEAIMNTKINTPEYVRAKNNVNSATYEALTKRPTKMDAKANTDMQIHGFVSKVENEVMIPTEMMVGVSTTRTLAEIKRIKRKKKLKVPSDIVTDKEIRTLQHMYQYRLDKKKK
jgi:hypothetical protein